MSSLLCRPEGDQVAAFYGDYLSVEEIGNVKKGDRLEVLCNDGLNYLVRVQDYDTVNDTGLLHFLSWPAKYDYRGPLQNIYLANAGTFSQGISEKNDYPKLTANQEKAATLAAQLFLSPDETINNSDIVDSSKVKTKRKRPSEIMTPKKTMRSKNIDEIENNRSMKEGEEIEGHDDLSKEIRTERDEEKDGYELSSFGRVRKKNQYRQMDNVAIAKPAVTPSTGKTPKKVPASNSSVHSSPSGSKRIGSTEDVENVKIKGEEQGVQLTMESMIHSEIPVNDDFLDFSEVDESKLDRIIASSESSTNNGIAVAANTACNNDTPAVKQGHLVAQILPNTNHQSNSIKIEGTLPSTLSQNSINSMLGSNNIQQAPSSYLSSLSSSSSASSSALGPASQSQLSRLPLSYGNHNIPASSFLNHHSSSSVLSATPSTDNFTSASSYSNYLGNPLSYSSVPPKYALTPYQANLASIRSCLDLRNNLRHSTQALELANAALNGLVSSQQLSNSSSTAASASMSGGNGSKVLDMPEYARNKYEQLRELLQVRKCIDKMLIDIVK